MTVLTKSHLNVLFSEIIVNCNIYTNNFGQLFQNISDAQNCISESKYTSPAYCKFRIFC